MATEWLRKAALVAIRGKRALGRQVPAPGWEDGYGYSGKTGHRDSGEARGRRVAGRAGDDAGSCAGRSGRAGGGGCDRRDRHSRFARAGGGYQARGRSGARRHHRRGCGQASRRQCRRGAAACHRRPDHPRLRRGPVGVGARAPAGARRGRRAHFARLVSAAVAARE